MPAGVPIQPSDTTLPPLSAERGHVCPRCHRLLEAGPSAHAPGALPRCPEHGLAYIDAQQIVSTGGDPILGTTVAGRFTVVARLGTGSMGAVYRARQEAVGRDVALKIVRRDRAFDPETKTRFFREARATSKLSSPHTVTVFDFGEAEDGAWFLAMELLVGETLGERLRRVTRLEPADAVRIARDALKSLAEAHTKGIVHRDLKPDNLFLAAATDSSNPAGELCKVLDFGIAKLVHEEERTVDQLETQAGTVFGTPRYMSPEQAQGGALDRRSDLYSLGVMLYQMLCGRAPFTDEDAVVVMARHIKEAPATFATVSPDVVVPPALESVVRRALAKAPEQRQASAEEFMRELDVALGEASAATSGLHRTSWATPSSAPSVSASERGARPRLGSILTACAVGLLLLVSIVVVRALTASDAERPVEPAEAPTGRAAPVAAAARAPAPGPEPPLASAAGPPAAENAAPTPSVRRAARRGPASGAAPPVPIRRKADERYGRFE